MRCHFSRVDIKMSDTLVELPTATSSSKSFMKKALAFFKTKKGICVLIAIGVFIVAVLMGGAVMMRSLRGRGGGSDDSVTSVAPSPSPALAAPLSLEDRVPPNTFEEWQHAQHAPAPREASKSQKTEVESKSADCGFVEHPFSTPVLEHRPDRESDRNQRQKEYDAIFQDQVRMRDAQQNRIADIVAPPPPSAPTHGEGNQDVFASNPAAQSVRACHVAPRPGMEPCSGRKPVDYERVSSGRGVFVGDAEYDPRRPRLIPLNDNPPMTRVDPVAMGTHQEGDCLTMAQRLGQGGEYPNATMQPDAMIQRAMTQTIEPSNDSCNRAGSLLACENACRQTPTDVICSDPMNPVASIHKGAFGRSAEVLNYTGQYVPQLPIGASN